MQHYYSSSTGRISVKEVHGENMPGDSVPITEEEHADLIAPKTVDYSTLSPEKKLERLKAQAMTAIDKTRGTVERCFENDLRLPPEWKKYRKALRDIISGKSTSTELPARPDYPEGT